MTDNFTKIVAREVATIITNNGQQISSISTDNNIDGFQLSPQQVLEVMQGNSQWLSQFEKELDKSFERVADKALDYWLRNTNKEIRESLKAFTQIANILLEDNQTSHLTSNNSAIGANSLQSSLTNFTKVIGDSLLKGIFDKESVSKSESSRSRDNSKRYRNSRGQIMAKLSKELDRGKRYT